MPFPTVDAQPYAWPWNGDFTQMGWFFTKAALLTFGGFYGATILVFKIPIRCGLPRRCLEQFMNCWHSSKRQSRRNLVQSPTIR